MAVTGKSYVLNRSEHVDAIWNIISSIIFLVQINVKVSNSNIYKMKIANRRYFLPKLI